MITTQTTLAEVFEIMADSNADTINIEYVTVEGTLRISGSYRNLEVEGASTMGSLLIPASTSR